MQVSYINAQGYFFDFVEGWKSLNVLEYDSCYLSIGLGSLAPFENHLQFNKIDKQGNHLADWTFKLDSTSSTESSNAQAIIELDSQRILIGAYTLYNSDSWTIRATPLLYNDIFTPSPDSFWLYNSSYGGPTVFQASLYEDENTLIHSAIGSFNSALNLITLKTNLSGDIFWENSFSCNGYCNMQPRHIITGHDGGYLFTVGEERRLVVIGGPGDHEIGTIIKVDSLGNQEWRIYPGGTGLPYTSEHILAVPTDDGNYLCAWTDNSMRYGVINITYIANPDATIWFAKIAPDGTKLWEKNIQSAIGVWNLYEPIYQLTQMVKLTDGNIIVVGSDKIIKITQDAEVIWGRKLTPSFIEEPGNSNFITIYGVTHTSDNGFICAGESWIYPGNIFPEFTQTGFVIKVDEYGCLEPDCHLNDPVSTNNISVNHADLTLFPNPAQDYITIEYKTAKPPTFIAVNITDLAGRVVYVQVLENQEQYLTIPTKDLPSGQYFCQLFIDGSMGASRKFVVVR